jgi:ABC-type methionine transport system ATPase subunit
MPKAAKRKAAAAPRPARKADGEAQVARPLELDFPARLVGKAVLYELIKRFDLVPNIKRANITQAFGYMQLELKGKARNMDAALAYLKKAGVGVAPIEKDVLES